MATTLEYALLSGASYRDTRADLNRFPIPQGWNVVSLVPQDSATGFEASAYKNSLTNEIVISYAGTYDKDISGDIFTDIGLATGIGSAQLLQAAEYYLQVKADNSTATSITFTGHSLGGGLAALMGVFFGQQAVTFDQAPFARSAKLNVLTPDIAANLKSNLLASGHTEAELSGLTNFLQLREANGGIPNSNLVTNINVRGEFLSGVPYNIPDRIGTTLFDINNSAPGVSGVDLHAQSLLTAFLQSNETAVASKTLNQVTGEFTDLLKMIFDNNLFANETDTNQRNFLDHLVRHQAGVQGSFDADAMVTRFTSDLWKLAQDGGLTMTDNIPGGILSSPPNNVSKALIAFDMQKYYDEQLAAGATPTELFTPMSGGVQFDRADVAALLKDAKGYNLYFQDYLNSDAFTNDERQRMQLLLPTLRDWYVQAGSGGMDVTDAHNRGAFMLGGSGVDTLTGGSQADLLVGNAGNDMLDGGAGADTMLGGQGDDTYFVDDAGDQVIEGSNNGRDTVQSSVTFTFSTGDNLENLTLTGENNINGTGNDLNNDLTGNDGVNWLEGKDGTDHLIGNGGNDILVGGTGNNDLLEGGVGLDTYYYKTGDGNDTIMDSDRIGAVEFDAQLLTGGLRTTTDPQDTWHSADGTFTYVKQGADLIVNNTVTIKGFNFTAGELGVMLTTSPDTTRPGQPTIDFSNGQPTIQWEGDESNNAPVFIAGANHIVFGRGGNDQISFITYSEFYNHQVFGGLGNDTVDGGAGRDRLYGEGDQDVLRGWLGDDLLDGGDGNDQLQGGLGNDQLFGGNGDDLIIGTDPFDPLQFGSDNDYVDGGLGNDFIVGGQGNDVLLGGAGDDTISGEGVEVNGRLDRQTGNDYLDGGTGNDGLTGGAGNDMLLGGAGDDILNGDNFISLPENPIVVPVWDPLVDGQDYLDGGDGNDVLHGGGYHDILIGGQGNDRLWGDGFGYRSEPGDDWLDGGAGNDELYGGAGADTLLGGDGADLLVSDFADDPGAADILDGGAGVDELQGGGGDDFLFGGTEADLLFGEDGNDVLDGGQGADELQGGDGNDVLVGGTENDRLFGDAGTDYLDGEDGADLLVGDVGNDTLFGGDGNDQLEGGVGADLLVGEAGDDLLIGGADADRLFGGDGNDILQGGAGDDELSGGTGTDTLQGGAGADTYVFNLGDGVESIVDTAGEGNKLVFGAGIFADDIRVGIGSLVVRVGLTGDVVHIQGFDPVNPTVPVGIETFVFADGTTLTQADLVARGFDLVGTAGDDSLNGGETYRGLYGLDGNDVLTGGAIDNVLNGGSGNDLLFGEGGIDQLIGGTGDDTLLAGDGNDVLNGEAGNDSLEGEAGDDVLVGGIGDDQLLGGAGNDSYFFNLGDGVDTIVDTVLASAGNKIVFGPGITSADLRLDLAPDQADSSLRDLLIRVGTNGDAIQLDTFDRNNVLGSRTVDTFRFADGSTLAYDQLLARGFDLTGTAGDDQLDGTNVADRMLGGDGTDVLRSGLGDDTLDGGAGNDRLIGGQDNDTYVFGPGAGQDTILEFEGSLDQISMAADVAPSDVVVTRNNSDLVLSLNGGTDQLTVSLYFLALPLQVEQVFFADGTVWSHAYIENLTRPVITGTGGNDVMVGTSAADQLLGLAGNDQLTGLAGDDLLDGGTGADLLIGGTGNDTYVIDAAGDVVIEAVNEGIDTIQSAVTVTLAANVEDLTLTGNGIINGTGNALDNVLTGNSAANVLTGGAGNDIYVIGAGDTMVELAGEGTDTVEAATSITLGANLENLTFTGSTSLTGIGNSLDNVLQADGSISVLAGGDGNDTYLIGPNGDDDILVETATGGIDTVVAGHDYRLPDYIENLTLLDPRIPDFGSFSLVPYHLSDATVAGWGNNLNNIVIGGRANNLLDGGIGADTMVGGAGDDTYIVDNISDRVTEQANEGIDTIQSSVTYTLSANLENLLLTGAASVNGTGNALNNDIRGNEAANVLDGGAGDDSLQGFGGVDTYLFGRGSGRDSVDDVSVAGEVDTITFDATVAPGDVEVYRRDFNLVLLISGTSDQLTLASFFDAPGYDQKQVRFAGGTVWSSAELSTRAVAGGVLIGSSGNDTIVGSGTDDVLIGAAGNDVLTGGRGNDTLYGDATFQPLSGLQVVGNDTLRGGAGDDTLIDFRGTNLFDGGAGNDSLVLGTGIDTVLFGRGSGADQVMLDNNGTDVDIIQMAAGIAPADVVLTWRSPSDVDLLIPDSGDHLAVALFTDFFTMAPDTIQAVVRFADGTAWNLALSSNVGVPTATPLDDVLTGSSGVVLHGLAGNDTYIVDTGSGPVVELPGEGIDTVQSAVDYTLPANVENLILRDNFTSVGPYSNNATGNALDNLIIGNTRDNILDGGEGNDILVGGLFRSFEGIFLAGTGSDILIGGAGDDVFMADSGNVSFPGDGRSGGAVLLTGASNFRESIPRQADDLFIGGTGNDTYILESQLETVAEFAGEGTDTVRSTVNYTLGNNVENLTLLENPVSALPGPFTGTGNELDNVLLGNSEDNVLSGGIGNDTLWGGSGMYRDFDTMQSGNDLLQGGAGNDTYLFNLGDGLDMIQDVAMVGEGNRIQFGAGITQSSLTFTQDSAARALTIQVGSSGPDKLILSNFDPTNANGSLVVETLAFANGSTANLVSLLSPGAITGTAGNDVLIGTSRNDTIIGGRGNDQLSGGAGTDTYLFNVGDGVDTITDTALPGEGNQLQFGSGIVSADLSLGLGSLLIRVGTNGDAIHLTPFDSNDALGTHAIETFRFADGTVLSYGQLLARGFDLTGTTGNNTITGTNVVDRISGLAGDDTLLGGAGDDVLDGGAGADTLIGGTGNDTYMVEHFSDVVTEAANEGTDTVQSSLLIYTLGANVENLTLVGKGPSAGFGNALANVLTGNSGANLLDGKAGADTMAGGAGDDLYVVDHVGDRVIERLNEGALDTVSSSVTYSLSANVEDLVLTGAAAINGTGNELDNILTGNSGSNVLTGLGGNDTYIIGAGDIVVEAAGGGIDTVVSGVTHTLSVNVENLSLVGLSAINGTGNVLDNVLNGLLNLAGNTLTGGGGNDTYVLGSGDQVVEGANGGSDTVQAGFTYSLGSNVEHLTLTGIGQINGTGNMLDNVLKGNSANNVLSASGGNDTLRGGLGNDIMNGGSGNDTFFFDRGDGQDLIQDNSGSSDKTQFGTTVNPLDLVISRQANDLRLSIHGSSDRVTIQNWYASSSNRTEMIQAGNGQMLLSTQVDQLIQAMAGFTQQTGLTWDQAIAQQPQNVQTVLAASWQ